MDHNGLQNQLNTIRMDNGMKATKDKPIDTQPLDEEIEELDYSKEQAFLLEEESEEHHEQNQFRTG